LYLSRGEGVGSWEKERENSILVQEIVDPLNDISRMVSQGEAVTAQEQHHCYFSTNYFELLS